MVQQRYFKEDPFHGTPKGNSGQHITSKLPYGYYNTPENKQDWQVDEEAAEVVREIFELYVHHAMGTKQIALQLQAENVSGWNTTRKYEKGLRLLLRTFIYGTAERLLPFSSVRNTSVIRSIFAHRLLLTRIRL